MLYLLDFSLSRFFFEFFLHCCFLSNLFTSLTIRFTCSLFREIHTIYSYMVSFAQTSLTYLSRLSNFSPTNKFPHVNLKEYELFFSKKKKFHFTITSSSSNSNAKVVVNANSKPMGTSPKTPLFLPILPLNVLPVLIGLAMVINAFLLIFLIPFKWKSKGVSNLLMAVEDKSKSEKGKSNLLVLRVPWRMGSSLKVGKGGGDGDGRREIAIKRVVEDEDERCVRDYSLFVTSRGDTLFTQSWSPSSVEIKGVVVILHGLNEHSGRYSDFAKQLNADGYKVYGIDWIGHGGSDMLHAYVHSLDDAVKDLKCFLKKVVAENTRLPCFCFGHSTGAAILLKVTMDSEIQKLINGVILTSPAIRVRPSHPIVGVIAPIVSFLIPKYQLSNVSKKRVPVSRDPEALIAKYSDPLVYTGYIRARTGTEILHLTYYLQRFISRLTVPFLVLHGTADTVTDPEASQKLYDEASSTDKAIKLYDGYLHDLLFEPEKDSIAKDIIEWLNSRTIG